MHDGRETDDDNDRLIDGDVLDGSSPTSPPTFSRRRSRDDVLDGDSDVDVHCVCVIVCVIVHAMVNDEIASGMVEI